MTKKSEIYKCEICGNIVEVLHVGDGTLVCCGQDMTNMEEKTTDESQEKHTPVIEKTDSKVLVKIGEIPHPMEEAHYIEWIELETKTTTQKIFLNPNDEPKAEFNLKEDIISARTYCNIHGLWKKDMC
ncbi:desulfoferrodoxin [archaeon]|nr:desulfoferrodoxin [archaeon]